MKSKVFFDKSKYSSGLVVSPIDDRDYIFGASSKLVPNNYLPLLPSLVFDQDSSKQCVACSIAYLRYLYSKQLLSTSYIYVADRHDDEMYEGMCLRSGCRVIHNKGTCKFSDFPGYYNLFDGLKFYKDNYRYLDFKASDYRVLSYYKAIDTLSIQNAIMDYYGVLVGIKLTDSFYSPSNGYINYIDGEKTYGGHAVVINGWKLENNIYYWRVHNSWGNRWGIDGEAWISFDDLQKVMLDGAYVFIDTNEKKKRRLGLWTYLNLLFRKILKI